MIRIKEHCILSKFSGGPIARDEGDLPLTASCPR